MTSVDRVRDSRNTTRMKYVTYLAPTTSCLQCSVSRPSKRNRGGEQGGNVGWLVGDWSVMQVRHEESSEGVDVVCAGACVASLSYAELENVEVW